MKKCSIEGCERNLYARGWCRRHYDRWHKHGDPLICLLVQSERGAPLAWIDAHAAHTGDHCLIWPFARNVRDGRAKIGGDNPCRIMCELAHGPAPTEKHEVAHSCGRGTDGCINPQHLRWATRKENHADKKLHGTHVEGEQHYRAMLTEGDVREIRSLRGKLSRTMIALKFGVSRGCISGIVDFKNWKHVS